MERINGNVRIIRNEDDGLKTFLCYDKEIKFKHIEFLDVRLTDFFGKKINTSLIGKRHFDFCNRVIDAMPSGVDIRFSESTPCMHELINGIKLAKDKKNLFVTVTINPLHVNNNNINSIYQLVAMDFDYLFVKFNSKKDLEIIDKIRREMSKKRIFGIVVDHDNDNVNDAILSEFNYITYNDEPMDIANNILSKGNHQQFMTKVKNSNTNMCIKHGDYDSLNEIFSFFNLY